MAGRGAGPPGRGRDNDQGQSWQDLSLGGVRGADGPCCRVDEGETSWGHLWGTSSALSLTRCGEATAPRGSRHSAGPGPPPQVSDKFAFGLFDLDWDVFTQHIEGAINRVPVLEKTGVKSTVCGPGEQEAWKLGVGILGAFGPTCARHEPGHPYTLLPAALGGGHCFTPLCRPETWAWRGQKFASCWAHSQACFHPSLCSSSPLSWSPNLVFSL